MRLHIAFFLSLFGTLSGRAQERVRNVRIQVIDSSQIEIRYDLADVRPGDSVYVAMESRLRGELRMLPEFIRGDIGKRITVGFDRRIVWDALANGYSLNEDIRATVLIKAGPPVTLDRPMSSTLAVTQQPTVTPTKPTTTDPVVITQPKPADPELPVVSVPISPKSDQRSEPVPQPSETNPTTIRTDSVMTRKTRYAGPAWALLSAVTPGIGNIFVQVPKPKVGLRPLLTIASYGLVVFGLSERQKSRDEYAIYEQQKNMTDAEPYYQRANSHHQNYFLATRGAIAIAAVDVILTFMKGLRNGRLQKESRRAQPVTLRPGIQAGQPTAVFQYSF